MSKLETTPDYKSEIAEGKDSSSVARKIKQLLQGIDKALRNVFLRERTPNDPPSEFGIENRIKWSASGLGVPHIEKSMRVRTFDEETLGQIAIELKDLVATTSSVLSAPELEFLLKLADEYGLMTFYQITNALKAGKITWDHIYKAKIDYARIAANEFRAIHTELQ